MAKENHSVVTEFILQGLSSQPRTQAALFIVFLFFYLFTVVGNTVIVAVVRADRQLRSPMYFFLANLSLDICYVSTNIPQMLVNLSTQKKTISFSGCAAQMYFSLAFGMTECILLAVMACDRYVAICQPLHYTAVMNGKLCARVALASWASSLLSSMVINSLVLRLPFCGPDTLNPYFCEVPAVLALACADTAPTGMVVFIFSILIVFIPFLLIIISYGQILATILEPMAKPMVLQPMAKS
ncbi:olfactory receptor 2G3-like [Eudromia elegans]